jgi:hypothetical protein
MENISKELMEKIKSLVEQGKPIEAVSLVQQELQLGLRKSKEIVDQYKKENK